MKNRREMVKRAEGFMVGTNGEAEGKMRRRRQEGRTTTILFLLPTSFDNKTGPTVFSM
jgi:hypothetical protein